jgi:hypothetical protein
VALVGVDAAPDLVALAERLKDGWAPVVDRFNRVGIPTAVFRAYVQLLPKPLRSPWFLQMNDCTARLTSDQLHTLAIDALASDTSSWQAAGAGVAGRYHFADAWARLLVLLDSPDPSVQKSAQTALEELRTYLDLKASFARYGEGGPEKALARARELTKSDDARLRRGGALALGALGEPAGVPDLMDLLDDPDPAVRQAALDALTRLGGAPVPGAGGKPKPK